MAGADLYGDEAAKSEALAPTVDKGHDDALVLWVRLAPGDPLSGSVGDQAQVSSFSFHGWIDFMGAINALRHPADTL